MTKLAYRIAKLKELNRLKKDEESPQTPVISTSESEPDDTIQEEKEPPQKPQNMPESLKGLNLMQLQLLFTDGQMDENESRWFQSRVIQEIDFSYLGPNGWMAF